MSQLQTFVIPRVKLGNQGLKGKNPFVSKLGLGCMSISGAYNAPLPEKEGIWIIKHAFSKGVTFFDTSDIYGHKLPRERALKQLPRERVQIATKFGIVGYGSDQIIVDGTPKYVRSCCEASLKRLEVEYVDLFYTHRINTKVPIEDTMEELKKLVEEGKSKYIGLSEASPDTRRAHAVHPISAIQTYCPYASATVSCNHFVIYSVHIHTYRELGIGIVPYAPLACGFSGGRGVGRSMHSDQFQVLCCCMQRLAEKHGCKPAQLALAWLSHQGDDVVPIPGTSKIKHLDSNIDSLRLRLGTEDMKEMSDVFPVNNKLAGTSKNDYYWISWKFANTPPKR
ncbi:hypothetical protein Tsubulata_009561 [Turnera subulata]|uniref:NADP-dependent oxidoreductase domain-containing protein n=1 Tax=Turnera subulata TaxID=218843 RepID=A0A9Q0G2U6_9ROSI|nr:hypothetical protein Tsubulata_009561 [Turnera subulata]